MNQTANEFFAKKFRGKKLPTAKITAVCPLLMLIKLRVHTLMASDSCSGMPKYCCQKIENLEQKSAFMSDLRYAKMIQSP